MTKNFKNKARGFTLIEILVVIGIIAILAAIVIIAINPGKQFAQARNTTRESNVSTILNAIGQNVADNKGIFGGNTASAICNGITIPPIATNATPTVHIGTTVSPGVDLGCLSPTYIPTAIPTDPADGTTGDTQYTIGVDPVGRVTVCSLEHAEASVPGAMIYCLTR